MSNNWHKQWKPKKGQEGQRMRWYNLPHNRVRLEFKDEDGTKAAKVYKSEKEAQADWMGYRSGAFSASELRAAGFV